jgi:hypothetical protein
MALYPPPPTASSPPPRVAPGSSNVLALVSFFSALYMPLVFVLILIVALTHTNGLLPVIGSLGGLSLPALITAIVTGHIALAQAKRYEPGKARRGFAIAGLVIGYLVVALVLLFIVAFTIAEINLQHQNG